MTGGVHAGDFAAAWRDRAARIAGLRARFEAGEALALADAIEALPPDDWSPLPAARLDLLAANGAAGAIVGTALGVDPADPLARLPLPAGAWPSARLVAEDFDWTMLDVLDGRVRLHAVEIRIASAVGGGPVPAVIPFPPGAADAEPPPCIAEAAAPLDEGEAAGADPEPLPGAMIGIARAIAESDRPFGPDELRAVFAGAGLVLDEAGQTITNAVDTLTGEERSGRAGRRPTLSALLITAKAAQLVDQAGTTMPRPTAVSLGHAAARWLEANHPDLDPLAPKRAERLCRRLLEAKS